MNRYTIRLAVVIAFVAALLGTGRMAYANPDEVEKADKKETRMNKSELVETLSDKAPSKAHKKKTKKKARKKAKKKKAKPKIRSGKGKDKVKDGTVDDPDDEKVRKGNNRKTVRPSDF